MKNIFIIILISAIVYSCGKTDEDKENEDKIIGKWYSTDFNYSYTTDTVFFEFYEKSEGKTIVNTHEDDFGWEIKRATLKTYYNKAPSYNIGYDQYNSKGVYKIIRFEENEIELNQYFYNGTQITAIIYRY